MTPWKALQGCAVRLRSDEAGSTVVIFAVMLTVLVGVSGMAIDYAQMINTQSKLQSVADASATAAAREMQLANADANKVTAVAQGYATSALANVTVQTNVDMKAGVVGVTVNSTFVPTLSKLMGQGNSLITANAIAKASGGLPLCLIGLDTKAKGTVHLEKMAKLNAPGCLIYSNSKDPTGLESGDNAVLSAGMICSAGGAGKSTKANYTPDPLTDCPQLPDPLASRATPSDYTCKYNNVIIDGLTQTLQPGVYCGGLKITNGAKVTLAAGVFIFRDGPFKVEKASVLSGTDVGIFLKGAGANLTFDKNTTITLSAPKDGIMAGLLIFDDPSGVAAPADPPAPLQPGGKTAPREHKILSDNARTLLGTIYMPQGRLIIDANKPIADQSAYTVIVVKQIDLHEGPNLVLNSNYGATDVPVPYGLGPNGAKVTLTK